MADETLVTDEQFPVAPDVPDIDPAPETVAAEAPLQGPGEPIHAENAIQATMDAIRSVENWAARTVDELVHDLELTYGHAIEALRRLTGTGA